MPESYLNNNNEKNLKHHFLTTKLGSKHNAISTPVQTTTKTCLTKYSETHACNYNSISNNKQQMMLTFKKKKNAQKKKNGKKVGGKSDSYTDPIERLIIFNPWICSPL